MLGRLVVGVAARTAGSAVALVTDPRRPVSSAAWPLVGTPQAAASSAVTLIATVAIGARRISHTPVSPSILTRPTNHGHADLGFRRTGGPGGVP